MADKKKKTDTKNEAFWLDVMLDYVAKDKSLAEIAVAREVSYSTLVKRARRERWSEERTNYRQLVVRKATNRLSSQQVRHYRSLLAANDRLAKILEKALQNGEEYVYNPGSEDEATGKQINTTFLRNVSELIDRTRRVADGLLGLMSVQEVEENELEREKIFAEAKSSEASSVGKIEISAPAAYKE